MQQNQIINPMVAAEMQRVATPAAGLFIDENFPGMSRTRTRAVSASEIEAFAQISGDTNPVHLDEAYASGTIFKGCVAHGMLTASLISGVIGLDLPGPGAIYLKQDLAFLAPVRPGDVVSAAVTVAEVDPVRRRVTLTCVCCVREAIVLRGTATVLAPTRPV